MGKQLTTKYSGLTNKILKKSFRPKKIKTATSERSSNSPNKKKRRREINDTDETSPKIPRLSEGENDDASPQEKVDANDGWSFPENEISENKVTVEYSRSLNEAFMKEDDSHHDLFFVDELKNGYFNFITKDFHFHIIDEICLEGLDGITLEAFWKRLLIALEGPLEINQKLKEYIWKLIQKNENLKFYELPDQRRQLEIHDRFKYINAEIGVVMELAYELPDTYPHELVIDPNVSGSCSTFRDRIDISDQIRNMGYEEVERYGQKLVIVASQSLRTRALIGELADPCAEMQPMEYCILERIGRSRKLGELTQGNMSLTSLLKMDAKSLFHYKKLLGIKKVISKQFFYIKSLLTDQNKTGRLLQLQRFFTPMKSKPLLVAEKVVDVLRKQPDYRIAINELRTIFGSHYPAISKTFKSAEFRKFVKTDAMHSYRTIYPNAKRSEYMRKSQISERSLRCFELKNPHINISASWNVDRADSDEDEVDEDEEVNTGGKLYNMEMAKDVYHHVFMSGDEGCSTMKMKGLTRVDKNSCRMTFRKLYRKGTLDVVKFDKGRQREMLYKTIRSTEEHIHIPKREVSKRKTFKMKLFERHAAARAKILQEHSMNQDLIIDENDIVMDEFSSEIDALRIPPCQFLVQKFSDRSKLISNVKEVEFSFSFIKDTIKLRYIQFDSITVFNPDGTLATDLETDLVIKANFENAFTTKNDTDLVTKVILLKAMFGEICIDSDSLCPASRKRKYSETVIPTLSERSASGAKSKSHDQKLEYMGDNPVVVFEGKDREVYIKIIVSSPPAAFNFDRHYPKNRTQTERIYLRLQIILDLLYEKKIIEDIFRMARMISAEESKTGYEKKIDRKSLARLLKKLVEEGYIKIYKIVIGNNTITKTIVFVCHPSVDYTNDSIQTSIQQIKWRYFIGCVKKSIKTNVDVVQQKLEEKIKKKSNSPFTEADVMDSIAELKKIEKLKTKEPATKVCIGKRFSKLYGSKPKFVRMKILHEFLFYLIYEQKDEVEPLNEDEVKDLFNSYRIELSEEDLEQLPKIYAKEISWKMFIPPLPKHHGWTVGWTLMCDVILRLPISVLCKLHACYIESTELLEILHHPIKRFYLVKDLPEMIRNVVLSKRKYLFSIHESICKLNFCGLLQYGPKKYKEKDQIFVYLNRRASLMNTTSTQPAYHKIEDKEYPQISFFFNSSTDLDDYWYNLNAISMNTKLNARTPGELITLIHSSAKPELMRYAVSKSPEEALRDDNGEIPGDRRGAAGLDSSLWPHLARNWMWTSSKHSTEPAGLSSERLDKVLPSTKFFKDLGLGSTIKCKKVFLHKTTMSQIPKQYKKLKHAPLKTSKQCSKFTRKIVERPRTRPKREYYDKIDRKILEKYGINRRMRWSAREDTVLMLCKVADLFLNGNKFGKQVVPYNVIRDVLRRVCHESQNKTSRAIQRRLKRIVEHPSDQFEEQVCNLHRLEPISTYFSPLANNIAKGTGEFGERFKLSDAELNVAFIVLMACILEHEKEVIDTLRGNIINVDHLSKENLANTVREAVESEKPPSKFEDPKNEDDIKKSVVKSVIHSSLTAKDQSYVALQLLKVYQKYPDHLIRIAVEELKQANTISCKKRFNFKKDNIWQAPFHLSQHYIFFQHTTFNKISAIEAFKTYLGLRNKSENRTTLSFSEETVNTKRYGQLLGMNEFKTFWQKLQFEFDLPQNVIILNPLINDHGELIRELAMRFQLKLKKVQENKESEYEVEPEPLRSSNDPEIVVPKEDKVALEDDNEMDVDDMQNCPIDLTDDVGNIETIDRLKTWVTDCLGAERGRSPSPDFLNHTIQEDDIIEETEVPVENVSVGPKVNSENNQEFEESVANNEKVDELVVTEKKQLDRIPTLEEIEEEMLRLGSSEDRRIPYITDLSDLLNKDNFPDLATLKRLKNHFVTQYAALQNVILDDYDHFPNYILEIVENKSKNQRIWNKVKKYIVVDDWLPFEEVVEMLKKEGGTQQDKDLMQEIIQFVFDEKVFGASGRQLKEKFASSQSNVPLVRIIGILVEAGIFLQTGICTIVFVHYKYQSFWLAETYQISEEDQNDLLEMKGKEIEHEEVIQKKLSHKKIILVKVMPWNKVDGTLNEETFTNWICNILSHCLDYPKISFQKLCEKFCYLKPVDIYYCLEVLQELGCINIFVYEEVFEVDLFSDWKKINQRHATVLDDLQYCVIEPNNVSMTCLGSFLHETHQLLEPPANILV